jgi:uncharacterized protein (TIGR04255 family)
VYDPLIEGQEQQSIMSAKEINPLDDAEPAEIPLASAPLARVLCQVRFTEIISIQNKSFIGDFQEAVRSHYPQVRADQTQTVALNERGVAVAAENIWRFVDVDGVWRLSLAPSFVSIETRQYRSRDDFIERLSFALQNLEQTIKPTHVTRIGTRYLDQVQFSDPDWMNSLLRPEMRGIYGSALSKRMDHAISEISCHVKEGKLLARWGVLPPRGSHDPDIMPPVERQSWFLDLDTFAEYAGRPEVFDSRRISETARSLAARAYSFFRWSVTDKFLAEFGGATK